MKIYPNWFSSRNWFLDHIYQYYGKRAIGYYQYAQLDFLTKDGVIKQ